MGCAPAEIHRATTKMCAILDRMHLRKFFQFISSQFHSVVCRVWNMRSQFQAITNGCACACYGICTTDIIIRSFVCVACEQQQKTLRRLILPSQGKKTI